MTLANKTILVVDDEELILDLIIKIMKRSGYSVVSASSAKEGLNLIDNQKLIIDLLITDVILPEIKGPELYGFVLQKAPQAKVIYISGYTAESLLHNNIVINSEHFLQKPFNPQDLLNLAALCLNNHIQ